MREKERDIEIEREREGYNERFNNRNGVSKFAQKR